MNDQPGRQRTAAADEQGLAFVRSFLATATRARIGDPEGDALADPARAADWAAAALAERGNRLGLAMPPVSFADADLERLRAFREQLRDALRAGGPRPPAADRVVSTIDLHWSPAGELGFRPVGDGWRAIAAVVTADLLLAEAAGRSRRLKTCAYDPCGFPFVDHSPNLTRNWHDTSRCGNVVNLRASRARRK